MELVPNDKDAQNHFKNIQKMIKEKKFLESISSEGVAEQVTLNSFNEIVVEYTSSNFLYDL